MKFLKNINEATDVDQENLRNLYNAVNSRIGGGLKIELNGYSGKILHNGSLIFSTNGSDSFSVIFAYVAGMEKTIKLLK